MCLFYATAMWNQFFNALMFLQDDSKMPLQVVLRNLVLMNQSNQMGSSASEMVTKQKLAEQLKYCVVVVSAFPVAVRISFPAEILRKRCYDRCSQADTEQKSYRYRVHGYNRHDFIVETQNITLFHCRKGSKIKEEQHEEKKSYPYYWQALW